MLSGTTLLLRSCQATTENELAATISAYRFELDGPSVAELRTVTVAPLSASTQAPSI